MKGREEDGRALAGAVVVVEEEEVEEEEVEEEEVEEEEVGVFVVVVVPLVRCWFKDMIQLFRPD